MRLHRPLARDRIVRITQRFNPPQHYGLDISCVLGTPLYAPISGRMFVGYQENGFGRYVRLEDGSGLYVYLAHMSEVATPGCQWVEVGTLIGWSGSTGNSTGPHLHLEVRQGGREQWRAIDPEPLIDWDWDGRAGVWKISWHVQRILGWMPSLAAQQGLRWVKLVNPPEGADPFPTVPRKVVRFWHDDTQMAYLRDGYEGGRRWVRDFLPRMRRHGYAVCFETANEPPTWSNDDLRNLRLYSLGAMQEADEQGIKLCILNLPEGNPASDDPVPERARAAERWKLEQLVEAVIYAAENGHYVGLHAYWLPDRGIGPLDRWHGLGRVEWNVTQWLEMGVNPLKLRVLVNETGVDGLLEGRRAGWRVRSGLEAYARDVATLEARAQELPWLEAYMLFTVGYEGEWATYDHEEGDLVAIHAALNPPPTATWYLPSTDPLTLAATTVPALVEKARWWLEEEQRQREAGNHAYADAIRKDVIALLYRAEQTAREAPPSLVSA